MAIYPSQNFPFGAGLYVRPENFGPYYVRNGTNKCINIVKLLSVYNEMLHVSAKHVAILRGKSTEVRYTNIMKWGCKIVRSYTYV